MAQMRLTMEMVSAHNGQDLMIEALCGGNAIAIEGCRAMLKYAPHVDPDYADITTAYFFLIDVLEIRDDELARLWKDVCGKHAGRMIALLRSCQSPDEGAALDAKLQLLRIIRNWPDGPKIDFDVLAREIKRKHPRFNIEGSP